MFRVNQIYINIPGGKPKTLISIKHSAAGKSSDIANLRPARAYGARKAARGAQSNQQVPRLALGTRTNCEGNS
jgi:hypothetical protein